ncbi:Transcriptional activator protein Anr [compost metagenome]
MSRGDIANYLDLTLETVSRLFSRFNQEGLIACLGREVRIINLQGLESLCQLGR